VPLDQQHGTGYPLRCGRDLFFRRRAFSRHLWLLVLAQNETASLNLMKAKLALLLTLLIGSSASQAMACATCMTGKDSQTTAHMAVAIWVMIGAVMSVLGGVSAFGIHLWRHANVPLEPHEQLINEDLDKYD
jgi:hypothetical protein